MKRGLIAGCKSAVLLVSLVAIVACEVEFTPDLYNLDLSTPEDATAIGTVAPARTLTGLESTGTAEAALTPIPTITPRPLANQEGDPSVASYQEVWCGDVERVCYELCYLNECGVYDASHPRVAQFIEAVDKREVAVLEWESEARTKRTSGITAFSSCATSVIGSAPAYAVITAADPEPISKTVLAVAGVVVAGVICVNSVLRYSDANTEQDIDEDEIKKQQLIAEQSFGFLRDYGEEVDIDE